MSKREGWICPKCGRVLSPDVNTCDCNEEYKLIPPYTPMPYLPPVYPRPYYPDWMRRPGQAIGMFQCLR